VLELAARHGVDMPITKAVASVLSGEMPPREAIAQLMSRQLKQE
jgi:glycerol-3-phosphate dehydrogenase (NAD(P)+)